jgi:carboxypeptidase Q
VLIGLSPDSQKYFIYHHTAADVFEAVDQRELELGAAAMAAMVYLLEQEGI